ncbi:MAG: hypothetical protein ACR2RB_03730 [Gammaproteobacteria bacterium]
MVRILIVVLAWPAIILIALFLTEWLTTGPETPESDKPTILRSGHPTYPSVGANALEAFTKLPDAERHAVRENLESNLLTFDEWLEQIRQVDYQIVCLGEDHEEATRRFLARKFFPEIETDVLLLEATPTEMVAINKGLHRDKSRIALLDADIAGVIRSAREANPAVILGGIEETRRQQSARYDQEGDASRDDSIVANFRSAFEPNHRHIILFGALHCSNRPDWLFERVRALTPATADKTLNVRVMGDHQDGLLESFVLFLEGAGIERTDFVIDDTRALHPRIFEWFSLMRPQTLDRYQTLVVFRM